VKKKKRDPRKGCLIEEKLVGRGVQAGFVANKKDNAETLPRSKKQSGWEKSPNGERVNFIGAENDTYQYFRRRAREVMKGSEKRREIHR